MLGRGLALGCALALLCVFPATSLAQLPTLPLIEAPGFQPDRDYFSLQSFEHIDTLSGALILSFTDLTLPGNAGRELRIQRTYNSKSLKWTFGVAGIPMKVTEPPLPTGTPSVMEATPTLHMSDGSAKRMAWSTTTSGTLNEATSRDFWKFNKVTSVLKVPNGDTCTYEVESTYLLRVDYCRDVFDNLTDFTWTSLAADPGATPPLPARLQLVVTQHVSTDTRTITLVQHAGTGNLMSLSYGDDTWTYVASGGDVVSVDLPDTDATWAFTYASGRLASVTTPYGGEIAYTYELKQYAGPETPQVDYQTWVVSTRSTSSSRDDVTEGSWTYAYDWQFGSGISLETVIDSPSGRTVHRHGWPPPAETPSDPREADPYAVFDAEAGLVPLRQRLVQRDAGGGTWVTMQTESLRYQWLKVLEWTDLGTLEIKERKITNHDGGVGTDYTKAYEYDLPTLPHANYHSDFHRPKAVTETGPVLGERKTVFVYQHLSTPFVVGLVTQETLTLDTGAASESYVTSAQFDTLGFKTSETKYGITTTLARNSVGNPAWVQKGNGKRTSFSFQYGQLQLTRTPEFTVTRSINPDGSVQSETRGGRTTSYEYDALGRVTEVQPPDSLATTVAYDDLDGTATISRGTNASTVSVDGFGREILMQSAVGVIAQKGYDAEGRIVHEGYPYQSGFTGADANIGTAIEYDALGRVTKRTHPDATFMTRVYHAGGHVVITDERGEATTQEWTAYGDPADASLVTLLDAAGTTWEYEYDGLKQLRKVKANSAVVRSWAYYTGSDRLQSETHPESGVTGYAYDAAGVLTSKTDAKNVVTTYQHDGNDRVRSITAGGRVTLIAYEAGTDNRLWATNQSASVGWKYDASGRLIRRQDRVGGKTFTTRYEYNDQDHLTAMIFPSGRRLDYPNPDAEGRPSKIAEQAATLEHASLITYHPSGALASYTAGNTLQTAFTFDPDRYWVTDINSGPLELTYGSYDGTGIPASINDNNRTGYDQAFVHDALGRLTAASGKYGTTGYGYDIHGNRDLASGYVINGTTLRLTSQGGTSFTYDNNGNTLTAGSATYTYTPLNELETSADLGVTATYLYDVDGNRIAKTVSGSTTFYVRDPKGELLTEWTDPGTSGGRLRDYIYLGSRLIATAARITSDDPAGDSDPPPPTSAHRYATSWQVPGGMDDGAYLNTGITAGARRSIHPDMPSTSLRLGLESGTKATFHPVGPQNSGPDPDPKQGGIFVDFEIERYPFSTSAEWLGVFGCCTGSSTNDVRLYLDSAGQLLLTHDAGQVTPQVIWSSSAIPLHSRHTIELRFEYNSFTGPFTPPNPAWENLTSWLTVYFDGALVTTWSTDSVYVGLNRGDRHLQGIELNSPAASNGLLMNIHRAGTTIAVSAGAPMEEYGTDWRTTLLQVSGPGTYTQWTGGSGDWQGRSAIRRISTLQDPVSSTTSGQKISYAIEPMLLRGITGSIGTVMVGVSMRGAQHANTKAFIRRNGIDTALADFTLGDGFEWYRLDVSGWLPTDSLEVGVTNGGTLSELNAVALLVEHNTPEPEHDIDTGARVITVQYTGNGAGQTVDLGVDAVPTALLVMPLDGVNGVEPIAWWESRIGAAPLSASDTNFRKLWPQRGRFNVSHTSAKSYNANGVEYIAVAIFDASSRFVLPFAVSKPVAEDNYTHSLRYPYDGAPASAFAPDFIFGGSAYLGGSDSARATYYRGPGHAGDLTAKLGAATASDADRIQSVSAGAVQFGTASRSSQGDHAFLAGRVTDGVTATRLLAVTSYVGNGAASRNITLNLSGGTPVFVLVVPTNASAKGYRVTGGPGGRRTDNGQALSNSITAMSADQITVGLAMNATGVTYDVWAIRTGIVPAIVQ